MTLYADNFCRPARTLGVKDDRGHRQARSPAPAAGLADHVWSMTEWFSMPAVQRCQATRGHCGPALKWAIINVDTDLAAPLGRDEILAIE